MASSSSSPSASVLSSQSWNYDVFLSFRGEDTRRTFVDHLYAALDQQGIFTYKDDVKLPRGESIKPALLKAIEESQIAVIIFSENYANSRWCLDELTHIMKCRDQRKQTVMPIFYDVEPSEVGKQTGKYKEAFENHELENKKKMKSWGQAIVNDPWGWLYAPVEENRKYREAAAKQELENNEKVESWRKALVKASKIAGWETKQIANGHEAQGIKKFVDEISQKLNPVGEDENLIGISTRVKALRLELQVESGGVRMIGIWGLGGGGKTTLASSLYDEISSMYDGCCFLNNIREESSKNGLEKLQEEMLSSVLKLKEGPVKVRRVEEGKRMIKSRLGHKKALVVLDDVDKHDQLKALVGSHNWFGEGSRIIITTRDEHLLNAHRVDVTHRVRLLNHDEALKLFREHAHGDYTRVEDFEQLSKEVVSYAGGLPLALTVLGSLLCDRNSSQWRSALNRLKKIPDEDILGKLRISFDGLKAVEKELFLEIACFFRQTYIGHEMKLLHACGFDPVIGVEVLRQKALIVITKHGKFDMHDLVQEMGHYIVRGEHPNNPEKHSRVWKREDVRRILDMDATTKLDNIEALDLMYVTYEESQRFLQVVANMNKLRCINLYCYEMNNGQRDEIALPLPENFPPGNIRCLKIWGGISQQQLWEGYKYLPNLAHMEFNGFPNLIKIPDFAGLPNLETFDLSSCPCLEEIHPSIGRLERLVVVSICFCPRLRMFPSITRIKKLETLRFADCEKLEIMLEIKQQDMDNLPHLHLDNSGKEVASCEGPHYNFNHKQLQFSHSALRKLDLGQFNLRDKEIGSYFLDLPNVEELVLYDNRLISRLDFSILRVPRLKCLNVTKCRGLVELSKLPLSIAVIIANGCSSLESFGDISNCKWLWNVSLSGNNKLGKLRGDTLIHSMLQGLGSENHFISLAFQHQFRNTFVGRLFRGKTFKMHLPDDWYNEFCGFLICIVTDAISPSINVIIKQEDSPFDLSQESDEAVEPMRRGHMTCIGYVSFSSLRHTTLLTSSYNIISFKIDIEGYRYYLSDYVGADLVPRKSKSDEAVQTTDCSEFWDKNSQDEESRTFTIHQYDSESSIEISWRPYYNTWEP